MVGFSRQLYKRRIEDQMKKKVHYGEEDFIINGFVIGLSIFALLAFMWVIAN